MARHARTRAAVGVLALLAVGGGAGWWAASTLLAPPDDVLAAPSFVLAEARPGSVGQTLRLSATARWEATETVQAWGSGVVTEVFVGDGDLIEPGRVLLSVDLRPVVVGQGDVPSFRDLARGVRGADVAQLQELLTATGHYAGPVDGVFGAQVDRAVREWQRSLGVARTGVVGRADVVFAERLPARVAPEPGLRVGAELSGAFDAFHMLADQPSVEMALGDAQLTLITAGDVVDLTVGEHTWSGTVAEIRPPDDGRAATAVLTAADGGPVCGLECGAVPVGESVLLPAAVHVVPFVDGVVVPAGAVVTTADGTHGVRLADGALHPVTLVTSAGGSAVVDGLGAGMQVRTPGTAS